MRYCFILVALLAFAYSNTIDSMESGEKEILQEERILEEQFMTDQEYGSYLYQDPRGISCKQCHGEYGKGKHILSYASRGRTIEIHAPDITGLSLQSFTEALHKSKGIMPKYYLTDSEIHAIHKYIESLQPQQAE